MIKVVSIGIIVGFTVVLSFIEWYWYKKRKGKEQEI